jgi:tetracycline resistance efflux pump
MDYGILSLVPILILIIGALITKRISEMIIATSLIGAILVYKEAFFSGYITMMYDVLSNSTYQFILINVLCFGAFSRQLQKSGALTGFRRLIANYSKDPLKPMVLAWILHFFLFINGYLNILVSSFAMRDTTDQHGIPREHLAFQIGCMSPSVSTLVPITSWTVFTVGLLRVQGLGFIDYIRSIPFMFFPILLSIFNLLLSLGAFPKIGALKEAYQRVGYGGDVVPKEPGMTKITETNPIDEEKTSSAWNFVIPVVVLVIFVFLFDNSLIHGLLAAIASQALLYLSQKLMTLDEFVNNLFEGAASMSRIAMIIFFAYLLNEANRAMGFAEFLVSLAGPSFPPFLLPLIVFLIVGFTAFATSGYWVIQVITFPIFLSLATSLQVNHHLIIAATMSGVTFGSMFCFYSDVLFMVAAGTGISNMKQISVSAPYVFIAAVLTSFAYVVAGLLI